MDLLLLRRVFVPYRKDGKVLIMSTANPKGAFMIQRLFRFACITLVLVLLNSNFAMSKRVKEEEPSGTSPLYTMGDKSQNVSETVLDSLNRGREISLSDRSLAPIIAESTTAAGTAAEVPNGFRVQVMASSQIEKVRAEQKSLESRVSYPLYIIVVSPYYKLMAGDFVKRNDADVALAKLKELGYADAWVIRSKIWTNR
jgi:SPOR domain